MPLARASEVVGECAVLRDPCRSWITDVSDRLRLGISMPIRNEFRLPRATGVEIDINPADLARLGPPASHS